MPAGFNLSPVIDLLGSFSVVDRATPDAALSSDVLFDTEHAQHADSVRALGDFGALWKFLQTPGREPGSTPPICDDRDTNTYGVSITVTQPGPPPGAVSTCSEPRKSKTFNVRFAHDAKHADCVVNAKQTPVKSSSRAKATIPKPPVTPKPKSRKVAATSDTEYIPHSPYIKSNVVASADKKVVIIEKLMKLYPETRGALLKVRVPGAPVKPPSDSDIHVFVDNSNILISFYEHIKKLRGFPKHAKVKRPSLSFHGLSLVLERGRSTAKRVLVGSSPVTREIFEAREMGYETSILERVEKECTGPNTASSGSETPSTFKRKRKVEQAVDEILHLKILESVLDYPPSTVVLASGDGAAGEYSQGFFKMIERCLIRGWAVEIVSFKMNLNKLYSQKAFTKKWEGKFRTVALDSFAEELLD